MVRLCIVIKEICIFYSVKMKCNFCAEMMNITIGYAYSCEPFKVIVTLTAQVVIFIFGSIY
jgi:hypothetical protein